MPDAPVQAITLDPNLLVNAQNSGVASGFNYGEGAQTARASTANANVMQANFLYGQDATNVRATDLVNRTKEADFNYGPGAQAGQTANTQLTGARTATLNLANDISAFDLQKQKLDEAAYGTVERENKTLAAQGEERRRQSVALVENSPTGQVNIAKMAQADSERQTNEHQLAAVTALSDLNNKELQANSDYANIQINNAAISRQRDAVLNRQQFAGDFNTAIQADAEERATKGTNIPSRQIAALGNALTTNPTAFTDNADVIAPHAAALSQTYGLGPKDRSTMDQVMSALSYHTGGQIIQGTLSNLSQARDAGQITDSGQSVLGAVASVGIKPNDPAAVLNLSVDKVGNGYVLTNTATDQTSRVYTPEEFGASKDLQDLFTASESRKANRQNALTKTDNAIKTVTAIGETPIHPVLGQRFSGVMDAVKSQVSDTQGVTQKVANGFSAATQSLAISDPWFSDKGDDYRRMLHIGEGALHKSLREFAAPVTEPLGISDPTEFRDLIKDNPDLAQSFVTSFANRERAGMSVAQYNTLIENTALPIEQGNSIYTDEAKYGAATVAENRRNLRSTIAQNLKVPTHETTQKSAYDEVIKMYPLMKLPDTSFKVRPPPNTLLHRIGESLRSNLLGYTTEQTINNATVPQQPTAPLYPTQ